MDGAGKGSDEAVCADHRCLSKFLSRIPLRLSLASQATAEAPMEVEVEAPKPRP